MQRMPTNGRIVKKSVMSYIRLNLMDNVLLDVMDEEIALSRDQHRKDREEADEPK